MNRMYKIGNHRVDEYGLERIYQCLEELRTEHVLNLHYFLSLTYCMEEVAKRSRRLKTLVERSKHEHIDR